MNRADLQRLSNTRIREAKTLFAAKEYAGAYYLAGYAVECALKACFAKSVRRYDFPERDVKNIFTHNLLDLVKLAKLDPDLVAATKANSKFEASWNLARTWTEASRYSAWTQGDAKAMIEAISGKGNGVLPWIKQRW